MSKVALEISVNKPGKSSIIMAQALVGSRNETPEVKGISHFLEHMCFKGTSKYNHSQISKGIESVGGVLNAFTDWEQTVYWAKIGNNYKETAEQIILDLASTPKIPAKEVTKERQVVLQEYKMYADDTMEMAIEEATKLMLPKTSSFYTSIIGTPETLQNMGKQELMKWHEEHYRNLVLIKVGDYPDNFKVNDSRVFIHMAQGEQEKIKGGEKRILEKDIEQTNMVIAGMVYLPYQTRDSLLIASLLESIYNDMSGRLFEVIREKHNMVYGVRFHYDIYSCGAIWWEVTLKLDSKNISKAYKLILQELNRPFSKKDVEYGLNKILGETQVGYDSVGNIGNIICKLNTLGEKYEEILDVNKQFALVKELSQDINAIQKKMQFNRNVMVAVVPKGEGKIKI
jgi:predicted Zn-dependent peptidase